LMVVDETDAAPDNDARQDVRTFLTLAKRHAVRGFMTSRYVLTDVYPYQLVPGHYRGCVPTAGLPIT
ncbi:MAG: hypothetical protein WBA12_11505, partial [Catalinimonas sp.]